MDSMKQMASRNSRFFERPILNSPYETPNRHWVLDENRHPTQLIANGRREASFITPVPRPLKSAEQSELTIHERHGLSNADQQYDVTGYINEVRRRVDRWRNLPSERDWGVTPETARLLKHWREFEYLYDKPYEDRKKVRVAGPFTVESISPHRILDVDETDGLLDRMADGGSDYGYDFSSMILDNLKRSGIQQAHKEDKIEFISVMEWPGDLICAEGTVSGEVNGEESSTSSAFRRAGIFVGPEFGTVSRSDLVEAAREAAEANFDALIACAFSFDAHTSELERLGKMPVLKARMNPDLHMATDLKNTGTGNLFVIFGEPDVTVSSVADRSWQVTVNGVDVFHPGTGEIRSDGPEDIACWFIDTDYDGESFFVRHAYFLGAGDPYKSLKTTLKSEIDPEAWESLHSNVSRTFPSPDRGRIAVKVINHLGDEVMKVFRLGSS